MGRLACRLCDSRPPRRFCPATRADICAPCCGEQREVTLDCPFDCEHLLDARRFEKQPHVPPASLPNQDVRLTDEFLHNKSELVLEIGRILFAAAVQTPGCIDFDVREALAALIQTLRTAESGLIYESRPANPIAASVQARVQHDLARLREAMHQRTGIHAVRDRDVLGVLVFWQLTEIHRNNGRRRGKAFVHSLIDLLPQPGQPEPA